MPSKMQAAVVEAFGKPLVLREWNVPSPGPGQILVKTEACGVCHTDLHAAHGDWPVVSGAGGLGHLAIQYAKAIGLHVCAVDIDDSKLAHAKLMGADAVINAKSEDAVDAAEGKVKADIELQPLSAVNPVLDRLERGEVAARVVLDFADS